jgi:hypothetical protein
MEDMQQHLQSIVCLPFSQNLSDNINIEKKQKNEQPWTLAYTLVFQTMSSPLSSFFFGYAPSGFPLKTNVS